MKRKYQCDPLRLMRLHQQMLNDFDFSIRAHEKDGIRKICERYEMLYDLALEAEPILCKYYPFDLVEDALAIARSGFIKWSDIIPWLEMRYKPTQEALFAEFFPNESLKIDPIYGKKEKNSGSSQDGF